MLVRVTRVRKIAKNWATMHLTNKEPIRSDALVASERPEVAGAPAITDRMVEAGMHEYAIRWLGLRDADDEIARKMVAAVYRVMFALQE